METSTALIIVAACLPTVGSIVVSVISAFTSRAVKEVDSKLERMDGKLDGHADRLTRLEARLDAQAAAVGAWEHRVSTLEARPRRR